MQPLGPDLLGICPKTFHDLRQNFLSVYSLYRVSDKRSEVSAIQSNKERNYK